MYASRGTRPGPEGRPARSATNGSLAGAAGWWGTRTPGILAQRADDGQVRAHPALDRLRVIPAMVGMSPSPKPRDFSRGLQRKTSLTWPSDSTTRALTP